MHIYAFGSVCRGEIDQDSDIDLLAIVEGYDARLDINLFSIYSYRRIAELWQEGNPFSWHLHGESRLIFAMNGRDYLLELGPPARYARCARDCEKFLALFREAHRSIKDKGTAIVFDLSVVFLSIRNIATCFALGVMGIGNFSRHSAMRLNSYSLSIPQDAYQIFERARILCTRGYGDTITPEQIASAALSLPDVDQWMDYLKAKALAHERI